MTNELEIYSLISGEHPSSIGELLSCGENFIVMRNYGKMLSAFHPVSCYCDILRALKFAHSLGITHNDVRSPNIVVNSSSNLAVLVDWGMGTSNSGFLVTKQKVEDVKNLMRLFIVNKYFHGFSPLVECFEDFRFHIPKILLPLIEKACNCEYDELLELLSVQVDCNMFRGVKDLAI